MPVEAAAGSGEIPFAIAIQGSVLADYSDGNRTRFDFGSIVIQQHQGPEAFRPIVFRPDEQSYPHARIATGRLVFSSPLGNILLEDLPKHLLVQGSAEQNTLRGICSLLNLESRRRESGWTIAAASFSSTLFPLMIRGWSEYPENLHGIYALLAHPDLEQSLRSMLAEPHFPWTLEKLADACQLSRPTLIRRFRELAKTTPSVMLARVRMVHARTLLRNGGLSLGDVGKAVGYHSLASFHRNFKAYQGVSPGHYRRDKSFGSESAIESGRKLDF